MWVSRVVGVILFAPSMIIIGYVHWACQNYKQPYVLYKKLIRFFLQSTLILTTLEFKSNTQELFMTQHKQYSYPATKSTLDLHQPRQELQKIPI